MTALSAATTPYMAGGLSAALEAGTQIRAQLDRLTAQASDGKVADTFGGLGASASTDITLNAALTVNQSAQDAIGAATGPMQVAQNALTQISSIASGFYSQTVNLNGLDPTQIDSIAADARSALQEVAGLLDSTDGSTYVFAGQDSGNPPVPDPDKILSSGFATQIAGAVGALATNGAAATAAVTLTAASSNAAGTSPFSAALSQPPAGVNALRAAITTDTGQTVPTNIMASANADAVCAGASTTGSYMRDIMRALATIGSLSSGQVNVTGFSDLVADTRTSLTNAVTALNQDAGIMGDRQTMLAGMQTSLGQTATALQTQVSATQNVDMASTISQLSTVQTQLEASYQIVAGLQNVSLVHFLTA